MTNEEKLNICYECPHYFDDNSKEKIEELSNTACCKLYGKTLIRGFILDNCPDERW